MALRTPLRRLSSQLVRPSLLAPSSTTTTSLLLCRPQYQAAVAVPTSTIGSDTQPDILSDIPRAASLPNPDPAPDSSSAALIRDYAPFMVATYSRPSPVFVKGEGSYLWDIENRRYLDLTAGIAVNALGHCDPEFTKLMAQQVGTSPTRPTCWVDWLTIEV
jgi:hypothetical protein